MPFVPSANLVPFSIYYLKVVFNLQADRSQLWPGSQCSADKTAKKVNQTHCPKGRANAYFFTIKSKLINIKIPWCKFKICLFRQMLHTRALFLTAKNYLQFEQNLGLIYRNIDFFVRQ